VLEHIGYKSKIQYNGWLNAETKPAPGNSQQYFKLVQYFLTVYSFRKMLIVILFRVVIVDYKRRGTLKKHHTS